jgi:hypothetical protein
MNGLWRRVLRSVYKKEPITGFVLIAGAMDVAIGSVDQSASLVYLGLALVGGALALRLWQFSRRPQPRRRESPPERRPIHALPAETSRPSLPNLTMAKKR